MNRFKQEKSSLPPGTVNTESDSRYEVKTFQPRTLSGDLVHTYEKAKGQFGSVMNAENVPDKRFNMHPASRKSLGIENEESKHLEGKIVEEVEKRVAMIREKAKEEGYQQGKMEGEQAAIEEFKAQNQPVYDRFVEVLNQFEHAKDEIFHANEQFLIQLVFQVAKQVILKDVKADPNYVKNLCALLVEQIGAKDHIKIKVGRDDFAQVESIRDFLKQQFSDLKNIQIDVSDEFNNGGCKVETDLARINASVDMQLQLINKALSEQ